MNTSLAIRDDMSLEALGQYLVKSGWFTDTRDVGQAIVKVLAGREIGIGPIASMTGINIIKGRVSVSANLQAAAVKRSGKYNYRVIEGSDKACEIEYYENGKPCGRSRFTAEDARKAGTQNMDKFPRNMLFARAMSNGVKWYAPDVFSETVYTPEEMGAETGEEGEVIDAGTGEITPAPVVAEIVAHPDAPAPEPVKPNGATRGPLARPYAPEMVKDRIAQKAAHYQRDGTPANDKQRGLLAGTLEMCFAGDKDSGNKRHSVLQYLTGIDTVKKEEQPDANILALLDWVKPLKGDDGAYYPDAMAAKEAQGVLRAALVDAGQLELA